MFDFQLLCMANDTNLPIPAAQTSNMIDRSRCVAEVHPAPSQTFNLNVSFGES
jgi:hypothetical protein